jgi:EEF1A lysine methyltransferase 4
MPPEFGEQSYWHARFQQESAFEWLASSETFLDVAGRYVHSLPRDAPILQLGCGTSDMHVHLRRRGFTNVTNVDYEPLAIERARAMEQATFGDVLMKYTVADILVLDMGTTFDLVLDKSTADAIACCEGLSVLAMARRVKNHLSERGVWVSLSFSADRFRSDGCTLPLEVEVIDKLLTDKHKPTDPDIFFYCFALQNGTSSTTLESRS